MTDHNRRLALLQEKLARRKKISAMLEELNTQLDALREEERTLSTRYLSEQEDVDKLERLSLSSVFYTLLSRKEERLEKERAEAYAALLKRNAARQRLRSAEEQIAALRAELSALASVPQDYAALLEEKKQAVLAQNSAYGDEICRLEARLSAIAAACKELEEALCAGEDVLSALEQAEKELDSAESWGALDLLGGGLLTDFVKYSHLDAAQDHILSIQETLRRYQAELADVNLETGAAMQPTDFIRFADFFFDDIFSSLSVLNRIQDAQKNISSIRAQISDIQRELSLRRSVLDEESAARKEELEQIISKA